MDTITRATQHHQIMAEIEKASRHDARIGKLADRIFPLLPRSGIELADVLNVQKGTVEKYIKSLRLAGYKIDAVGKHPDYVYMDGGE